MKNLKELVDLHTHTNKSDGTHSPWEQVKLAKETGLAGLAITDHDTIDGWDEALSAGKELGIEVVPGVEISSVYQGFDIHILGYYMEPSHWFRERLENLRGVRNIRNKMMVQKLRELGLEITLEEVERRKKGIGGNIGRPHIAEVLMEKGIVASIKEAFDQFLGRDGKAYVNPPRISPHEAVELILAAGGVPVLAHPGLYEKDELIPELVTKGLIGIEAYHADHGVADEEKYAKIGSDFGLILTGGSDYHGKRNGEIFHGPLGSKGISLEVVMELKKKASAR